MLEQLTGDLPELHVLHQLELPQDSLPRLTVVEPGLGGTMAVVGAPVGGRRDACTMAYMAICRAKTVLA